MIKFKSKAENLSQLEGNLKNAKVLPQVSFTVSDWEKKEEIIKLIQNKSWSNKKMIVRSSAFDEDTSKYSMAGKYESILGVEFHNLSGAITKVIKSFDKNNKNNGIFVQPLLSDVELSGVAFSKNPNNGGDYTVINYDKFTGKTNSVTSGKKSNLETIYYFNDNKKIKNKEIQKIISLLKELKKKFNEDSLDIEFAIEKKKKQLFLLQVRKLNIKPELNLNNSKIIKKEIEKGVEKFKKISINHPYLYGKKTIFGLMPDWNPAEIIGTKPKPLSLSLYKELITDNIWAYQRDNYGYKNLRSFPLLINFCGMPYIDVRVSFNSFIPASISGNLANKLVNFYVNQLTIKPELHDKVEFDILFSCYTLDIRKRSEKLLENGFTKNEINTLINELRLLTNNILYSNKVLWKDDIKKIENLINRKNKIIDSNLDTISKIYWLIEDCKRYGTLPFAGLARASFIATQLLQSLVNSKILSQEDLNNFLESLHTVNSEILEDLKNLNEKKFLKKYGHLRPGTYDILQPRYDEDPKRYFSKEKEKLENIKAEKKFSLSISQMKEIRKVLKYHKIDADVVEFFDFIKQVIEGREYAKFIFTSSLSDTLQLIENFCKEEFKIYKNDAAFLNIKTLLELYSSSTISKDQILSQIKSSKYTYSITKQISLPPLITREEDFWWHKLKSSEPNFITSGIAEGEIILLLGNKEKNLKGKILFIESADPGYDWIFSHKISGFVTMYGGVNSHMAIRASELGIPAIIGAGENLFKSWSKNKKIEINCTNKKVSILK